MSARGTGAPRAKPASVSPARVIVLPNRNAIGLAALALAMWYAGASQQNGAAYLLLFVLCGLAAISAVHAWANLAGLEFSAGAIRPGFVGEELRVPLTARARTRRGAAGVKISAAGSHASAEIDTIARDTPAHGELWLHAARRGRHNAIEVEVSSIFPLGFFTARRRLRLRADFYIYPRPDGARPLPQSLAPVAARRDGRRAEGDDFAGLRAFQPGESQRHIDWKAAARGQPLLIKQWAGDAADILALEWAALGDLPAEARLRQLARWVILAERGGYGYALALPGTALPPARGETHYHACLRALADHEEGRGPR